MNTTKAIWRFCKTTMKIDQVPLEHARRVFGQCYHNADESLKLAQTEPIHTPYFIYCVNQRILLKHVKGQSGSILPEICWLFATLLLVALFIVPTVRHYDGELTARLNHSLELKDLRE